MKRFKAGCRPPLKPKEEEDAEAFVPVRHRTLRDVLPLKHSYFVKSVLGPDMVKLSAELIEQAAQYTNPVRDRELDLRGE